jgi:hypothetical protein
LYFGYNTSQLKTNMTTNEEMHSSNWGQTPSVPHPGPMNSNVVSSPLVINKTVLTLQQQGLHQRPAVAVTLALHQQTANAWGLAKVHIDMSAAGWWHLPGGADPGESNPVHGTGVAFGIGRTMGNHWVVFRPVIAFYFSPDQHGTFNFRFTFENMHWHQMYFAQGSNNFAIDGNGHIAGSFQL